MMPIADHTLPAVRSAKKLDCGRETARKRRNASYTIICSYLHAWKYKSFRVVTCYFLI